MRALWVFHFPVYGGPHNTAVGVRGPLADLGWETLAALTDEPGNAEQRLTEGAGDGDHAAAPTPREHAPARQSADGGAPFAGRCARSSS